MGCFLHDPQTYRNSGIFDDIPTKFPASPDLRMEKKLLNHVVDH